MAIVGFVALFQNDDGGRFSRKLVLGLRPISRKVARVGDRYFEKLFSITIPIGLPSLFSIFDYRPIML